MLVLSSRTINIPILSFRDGQEIAQTSKPIIDPDNLTIPGFYTLTTNKLTKVLLFQDIREITLDYIIVNSDESLTNPEDLIRLQKILHINYNLIGKPVETIKHKRVGKVFDFTINLQTMIINNLEVNQSLYRNFKGSSIKINRSQIIEINDKKIIVDNLEKDVKVGFPVKLFNFD